MDHAATGLWVGPHQWKLAAAAAVAAAAAAATTTTTNATTNAPSHPSPASARAHSGGRRRYHRHYGCPPQAACPQGDGGWSARPPAVAQLGEAWRA